MGAARARGRLGLGAKEGGEAARRAEGSKKRGTPPLEGPRGVHVSRGRVARREAAAG